MVATREASLSRTVRVILIAAFWTLLGLFFVSETYLASALMGQPISWQRALWYEIPGWYVWALLAPVIFALGRRVPITRDRWLFGVFFHAAASALFSLLHLVATVAIEALMSQAVGRTFPFATGLRFVLEAGSHLNLLTYWAILAVSYALSYYRRDQEREIRASRLQAQLVEAQLQVLRMELHPHFLFNTLNAISALMHKDVDAADKMVARLGELLRLTLESSGKQEVALREELEFLNRYLEIEKARFRERLRVDIQIEPGALDARVPNLLLQPIVENAIRHGIAPRSAPGCVSVSARRNTTLLELRVQDDGNGASAQQIREGVGLSNTRARLTQLYGTAHTFEAANAPGGGFVVRMVIPFTSAETATAESA